jgi:hypothetical protein
MMVKTIKIKVSGYKNIPKKLLSQNGETKEEIEIDIRRIALEIAKDQRSVMSSDYFKHLPLLITNLLIESLNKSHPSAILEVETDNLKKVIDNSFTDLILEYRNLPIQKYHRSHLSYNIGTGIGRVVFQDYLDVCFLDNIDYYYESYLKNNDFRIDQLNKLVIKKIDEGDGPDVICLNLDGSLCLGEFKGRIDSKISAKNYSGWKKQFKIAGINATDGRVVSDVNHICAASIKTNKKTGKYKSTIHIVDPPNKNDDNKIDIKITGEDIFLNHYHFALKALGYNDLAQRLSKEENNISNLLPEPTEGKIKIKGVQENYIVPYSANEYLEAIKILKPKYVVCLDEDIYNVLNSYRKKLIGAGENIVDQILRIISNKAQNPATDLSALTDIIHSKDGFNLVPLRLIEGIE